MTAKADIGVIGGSGLYNMEELQNVQEVEITTPFGKPSDHLRVGQLSGKKVAFLPRHGRHHSLLPSELPHRANIYAMKTLGVKWIISLSAVGSLKEELKPGDFVFPDQFVDRTKREGEQTFFGKGIVAHVSFGSPVCSYLQTILFQSARTMGATCHWGGTYLNMEGPAFSTRAESHMHRTLGFSVVGMTNMPEARLAREAEIAYATVAMVTDYDCWHEEEVDVQQVIKVLQQNAELAKRTVSHAVSQISVSHESPCHKALVGAIMTPQAHWNPNTKEALEPLLKRFLS